MSFGNEPTKITSTDIYLIHWDRCDDRPVPQSLLRFHDKTAKPITFLGIFFLVKLFFVKLLSFAFDHQLFRMNIQIPRISCPMLLSRWKQNSLKR